MIIFSSIKTGLYRSLNSWKAIFLIWFVFLILVSALVFPFRNALNSSFGSSMISEKLADGFNIMAFTDLGPSLKILTSYLSGGFVFIFTAAFVINAFLTGGLFNCLAQKEGGFLPSEFFSSSAKHFLPFLIITLMITFMIIFVTVFLILVIGIFAGASGYVTEKSLFLMIMTGLIVLLLLLPFFLLVADYSRAKKVSDVKMSAFGAIRFGFAETFRRFRSSYSLMIMIILVQILFGFAVISVIPYWKPDTAAGIFILFLTSQASLLIRLFLKSWRYASVTVLMENNKSEKTNRNIAL